MTIARMAARVLGLAWLVAACATDLRNPQVPPPGSESFVEGYLNGCPSGFADAGREGAEQSYVKDAKRYATEPDYRSGWDAGHLACYEEERRHPKTTFMGTL